MINFVEIHVKFILEFPPVLFPLDGESFWLRNSTHPVTHGYRIQHLKLDGRIGEQYLVGGLVEQLSGIPVT
jgi:hypothetical protein